MATEIIFSEAEYENALERIYDLLQLKPALKSTAGNELEFLTNLVEKYEAVYFPIFLKKG
jgi:HTH-type transcriptional regulator / antitoxin HigA